MTVWLFCIVLLGGGCTSDERNVAGASSSNSAPSSTAEMTSAKQLHHNNLAETLALLDGSAWDLEQLGADETDLSPGTVTLEIQDQRFAGSSGCNRYQTSVTETDAGLLTLGPIAGTMMACGPPQDELESRYISALQNVTQMNFLNGQLALTYDSESGEDQLIFSRQSSAE